MKDEATVSGMPSSPRRAVAGRRRMPRLLRSRISLRCGPRAPLGSSSLRHSSCFAFSFIEVLVSLVILLFGILAILVYFPNVIRANDRALVLSDAALLAQLKAEEIRRDDDRARTLIAEIRNLIVPTDPVVFPENPNLAYRFCGVSLLFPNEEPGNPASQRGVARVIITYAPGFRSDPRPLYELRFNE